MTISPDPKHTVLIGEEGFDLFMSYGLLTRLLKMFRDEQEAMSSIFDSELRDKVLVEVLTKRGQYGALASVVPDELDMTAKEVSELFAWVTEHLTDFFLRAGETTKVALGKYEERGKALQQSVTGSKA